jgi:hypothetical protein
MEKTQFNQLLRNKRSSNTICYIAKENDYLKTGAVFTISGLNKKINQFISNSSYSSDLPVAQIIDKTKTEIINAVELGNPKTRAYVITANDSRGF